nr:N-6 DNA methylase [Micromonospora craniellae]
MTARVVVSRANGVEFEALAFSLDGSRLAAGAKDNTIRIWAWRHIESHQPAAQISDVLGIAGAFLLTRADETASLTEGLPTPRQLTTRLRALDPVLAAMVGAVLPKQWSAPLTTLLRTLDELSSEQGAEAAFEHLHGRYVSSAQSLSGLAGTPDVVAEVMVALAGSGARTLDFTSGTGSILRVAADRALRHGAVTRCHAQEINPQYALITLLRLWFVHLRARRTTPDAEPPVVHVGDSLIADALPGLQADVVVANFPFGVHDWGHDQLAYDPRWTYGLPPRTEPELAWVQHALAHLSPGGTAVVLMPPAAAARSAGRRVRAELVRRGALRAVVALPAGLMPPAGLGLHVWVLTQPDPRQPPTGDLLVLDATATPASRTLAGSVSAAWDSYRTDGYAELPGVHRAVPAIEVLDDQVDLTPQRHLPQAGGPAADPVELLARIDGLAQLLDEVRHGLPAIRQEAKAALREAPRADIIDLIRSGSVSVHRAASRSRRSGVTATSTVLTIADILSGGPATGTTTRLADDNPGPQVRPGDVLVPAIGQRINARVATDDQVGAELGSGAQLLRVDTARFDPWFVAGIISRSDNLRLAGRPSSTANGALRIDIRRLSIPVVPLTQQRAYGRAFRQLVEFRSKLDRAAAAGGALAREISDSLAAGTLDLGSGPT